MKFKSISSFNWVLAGVLGSVLATSIAIAGGAEASKTTATGTPAGLNLFDYLTVTTSPFTGVATAADASDVLSQAASMNRDITVMKDRQQMEQKLESIGRTLGFRPIIEISGKAEVMALENWGYTSTDGDVNLSTVLLDFNAVVSPWASAFIEFAFDDSPSSTGNRVDNSNIFLRNGFINIGNLDVEPFYGTAGQMFAPFGRYFSTLITTPATQSLGRIANRVAVVGYYKNGFNLNGYFYGGEENVGGASPFKQGGGSVDYKAKFANDASLELGAGLTSSISESQGMQDNGNPDGLFQGFSPAGNHEEHRVPAVDGHIEFVKAPFYLVGEFVGAVKSYAESDLTFNDSGADPKAAHIEGAYTHSFGSQSVNFVLAGDHTWEALGANLPQNSVTVNVNTSFWKNTIESIEWRHAWDYSTHDSATGLDDDGDFATDFGTGKQSNLLLAQVGAYF